MKNLIFVFLFVLFSFSAFSETVKEGKELHPNASFYYCKQKEPKKMVDGNLSISSIERIAMDGQTIWIKFYGQEDELSTRITGKVQERGNWNYIPVVIGKIGLNIEDEKVSYYNNSGELLGIFDLDVKKSAEAARY